MNPYRPASEVELADWDAATVDPPGGHVLQSRAWAEHRRRGGWEPRFLVGEAGRVLALVRPWPIVGGGSAYLPRGPAPVAGPEAATATLLGATAALTAAGVDVVAADPEIQAGERAFSAAIQAAGFRPIEELQPARHRLSLPLGPGADEAAVLAAIAKPTRQRIRGAERSGVAVVRHDRRAGPDDGVGEGFTAAPEPAEAAFERFVVWLRATGERRGFGFGSSAEFVAWWLAALAAGHLVHLEARVDGVPIAGLLLYRHGRRLSTVHSADRAEQRRAHPGALHLLRWRAIQLAIREGAVELDLGGVDVPGRRAEPQPGDPTWGLYQHKRSFGGVWVELAGAHERTIRPWRYTAGRVLARLTRAASGGRAR